MNRTPSLLVLLASTLAACLAAPLTFAAPPRLGGPYTHDNLTVFLIHGAAGGSGGEFLTLQDALDRGLIVVHETGSVNELSVENLSPTLAIFISGGDIVKGGRQDRMLPQDVLLPPRSGTVPLASFCVERGRWSGRGQEPAAAFHSADDMVVGSRLKIAARRSGDQVQVWQEVAKAQRELGVAAGAPVTAQESPSSLQLTLQSPPVRSHAGPYVEALAPVGSRPGIVGCVFAVNGSIRSAEIYDSPGLFRRMWPKLLKSAAVEAVAGRADSGRVSAAQVRAFLAEADQAPAEDRDLSPRERLRTRESANVLRFETLDRARGDAWVHRSYVAK